MKDGGGSTNDRAGKYERGRAKVRTREGESMNEGGGKYEQEGGGKYEQGGRGEIRTGRGGI